MSGSNPGRSFGVLLEPEVLVLLIGIISYFIDSHLSVIPFLYGYLGFVVGTTSTLITPYSLIMTGVIFSGICVILFLVQVKWWRCIIIGTTTALGSLVLFEMIWDLLFLVRTWPITSWFGFPLPVMNYIIAFISLIVPYFAGIKYWKRSYLVLSLWIATIAVFTAWYLAGYPQIGRSLVLNEPYFLNVSAKVLLSLAMMSPVISWGYARLLDLKIVTPFRIGLKNNKNN